MIKPQLFEHILMYEISQDLEILGNLLAIYRKKSNFITLTL